MYVSINQTI